MVHASFTASYRAIAKTAAWILFSLAVIYGITTTLGLLALPSPQEPIGEPFFSTMELLIVVMSPLMVIVMVAVQAYAPPEDKIFGWIALAFMILAAGITSCVHFVILTFSRSVATTASDWAPWLLSFTWPSVVYALDILAWDWFFALSMLFAAPVFKGGRLESAVRNLMILSGILSLSGLLGVPLSNMQIRNIGILGYGVVAPVIFLLLGILFERHQVSSEVPADAAPLAID